MYGEFGILIEAYNRAHTLTAFSAAPFNAVASGSCVGGVCSGGTNSGYWSSDGYDGQAYLLFLGPRNAAQTNAKRNTGYSIRCVAKS